jgi:hypothetical protein
VASKRASKITQPRWRAATNNKSVRGMIRAATTRARVARAMVTAFRVAGNKECGGSKGHGISNEDGMQGRGQWQQQGCQMSDSNENDDNGKVDSMGNCGRDKAGVQQRGKG